MNRIYILLILVVSIACKPKLPASKEECLRESKKILEFTQKGDFNILKKYLSSKGYLLNYSAEDLEKAFSDGSDRLKKEGIPSDEDVMVSIDTVLNAGSTFNYVTDYISIDITFFCKRKPFAADTNYFHFLFHSTSEKKYTLGLYLYSDFEKKSKMPIETSPK